ncbi:hypothetical protein COU20_00070 [Candidatus Kaiserbacteria bacterium CG10_big_fil_rev_8_21_14_0_10_59_10]|uniref:Uncharacterized protein n=1 Tax=Candidatus Kaiserbacteria bacterium CG10_big_fil_rev_8_21_14_0_10_59_10 TaxID=1974612 RepID=A0A2H0U8Y1_9BACT|nr:MAG: hypothetical protein COU20_00070 [Candidatus Kaiserbacteria bacterium CG10_big_fil_rev_8_21_14_0_10_59_10]
METKQRTVPLGAAGALLALLTILALVPAIAFAHERQEFIIGGETYQFTVGSLNEPITVDDRTGVDLRVTMPGHAHMAANDHHGAGGAVVGLEETLKVELIAGNAKKVLDLSPAHGSPGAYYAVFYPTVATTLSYRVFGELNHTPIDLTFTCTPAGHERAPEDTSEVQISEGVVRTLKTGSWGCPTPKEVLGFPEESASLISLAGQADTSRTYSFAALGVSIAALATAFLRRRK